MMKSCRTFSLVTLTTLGLQTFAAVPHFDRSDAGLEVQKALRLPVADRLQRIGEQGSNGRLELKELAFDETQSLETRWRAITALGRLYPKESQALLEKALKSPEWFMRNAAVVVVPYGERKWAIQQARLLIYDSSLVVRTAAVQSLRQLNAKEAAPLLWEKLNSTENYRAGQSLWIRRHILEALSQWAEPGQEKNFVTILADKDATLHPIAMRTLSKLTRKNYQTAAQWQGWYQSTVR